MDFPCIVRPSRPVEITPLENVYHPDRVEKYAMRCVASLCAWYETDVARLCTWSMLHSDHVSVCIGANM